ncbi:Glyoxalase/Bleomycin resistance protein/Dihydroxybiphenyl dioxygenase [Coccomyxa subellipsoidea C-169]|uniref:Glyoxalase/Bleomycin resistance protein/Dihydroxybiphenyl dioxygenase n=1 Tax=Coccomyxa subellipsoidea (strain C-169) TaxID=574566 RepID=I0YTR6_COCSC|nr:Glyoxalase/Bleomycin resistance protein/Dihydroxybiphenyl dioxygenase [Coccomyxa subellipsoidea C-169]EIE21785.1 Glyoxalase/Bleomycin resistance protein/Dihydroxybiphenyl dioxygenase [Coccomyxa subellipsoidea C-169]|eukprot:XP_005646329.1 Glyoxalase/Bleomycin resistance protein/Dihydroxybiphenyl dioxygenase [Coccomyxa subellipsoidea C-169]
MHAPVAAPGSFGYTEQKAQTYLGEIFWKSVPPQHQEDSALWETDAGQDAEAPIELLSMNHAALGVQDVESMTKFYTRVLGMKQLPRPPFPFAGAWLQGGGLTLHLIDDDPTIPRKDVRNWKEMYDADHPEPWYIRRAFAVASLEQAELRLKHFNIEFHKFLVPGTNASQIFLYDPEGNGIELGEHYDDIAASLKGKSS